LSIVGDHSNERIKRKLRNHSGQLS